MLVNLGKLLDGEEKSKKDDIDIGVHDESGALYLGQCQDGEESHHAGDGAKKR